MKASKKLIGASAALIAALAVSVGSTYAWFTNQDNVTVSGIEASVTTGDSNLEVVQVENGSGTEGINGTTYTYLLTSVVLEPSIELKALTTPTANVTDKGGIGLIDSAKSPANTTNPKDYIEFFLRFRSNDQLTVKLNEGVSVTTTTNNHQTTGIQAWDDSIIADTYGAAVTKGSVIDAVAANATRVAFLNGATTESHGVWEPNEALDEDNTGSVGKGFWKGNLAKDYETHFNTAGSKDYTEREYTRIYPKGTEKTLPAATNNDIVELEDGSDGYYYATVCIRIWIEGTDGDCFNNILSDNISISLGFIGEKAE